MPTDPFDVLGVAPRFDLDLVALAERHRALSGALHPDRYVGRPASERRMALDRAVEVNAAWRALRDPILRTEMLLRRHGHQADAAGQPPSPSALLLEMMLLREQLAEARGAGDRDRVGALSRSMSEREQQIEAQLARGFAAAAADPNELEALPSLLGELRYVRRFHDELRAVAEELEG